jgi:hypothetical protein
MPEQLIENFIVETLTSEDDAAIAVTYVCLI